MPISCSRRPPSFSSLFPTSICSRPTCGCAGRVRRSRCRGVFHRVGLRRPCRRGLSLALPGQGRGRRDRIHAARGSTRQAWREASHSRTIGRALEWNVPSILFHQGLQELARAASSLAVSCSGRRRLPAGRRPVPTGSTARAPRDSRVRLPQGRRVAQARARRAERPRAAAPPAELPRAQRSARVRGTPGAGARRSAHGRARPGGGARRGGPPLPAGPAVSGVLGVPAILFKFKNTPASAIRPTSQFDDVLFAPSPTGASAGRPYTYASFYAELSNGLLTVQGRTYGYAALDSNEVTYTGVPGGRAGGR